MDKLKNYQRKTEEELAYAEELLKLNRTFWKFLRRAPCSQRQALAAYKLSSTYINGILWMPETVEVIKMGIARLAVQYDVGVTSLGGVAVRFLEENVRYVHSLEDLFRRAPPTKQDLQVFRGLRAGVTDSVFCKLKIGETVTPRGFVSTSTRPEVSTVFTSFDNPLILRIHVPKGTRVLVAAGMMSDGDPVDSTTFDEYMKGVRFFSDPGEVILNKNCVLKLTKKGTVSLPPSENAGYGETYAFAQNAVLLDFDLIESQDSHFNRNVTEIKSEIGLLNFTIAGEAVDVAI